VKELPVIGFQLVYRKKKRQKIALRRKERGDFAEKKLPGQGAEEAEKRKRKNLVLSGYDRGCGSKLCG